MLLESSGGSPGVKAGIVPPEHDHLRAQDGPEMKAWHLPPIGWEVLPSASQPARIPGRNFGGFLGEAAGSDLMWEVENRLNFEDAGSRKVQEF